MTAPAEVCHICGFREENPNLRSTETKWTRPGLCRTCAGFGYDWTPCRPCSKPIVWAITEKNRVRIPIDCRPPTGMVPNIILIPGDKLLARHAHPEYIRLNFDAATGCRLGVAHHATCAFGHSMRRGK